MEDYSRIDKTQWFIQKMSEGWYSRQEIIEAAKVDFPDIPKRILEGTIGQYWSDAPNEKWGTWKAIRAKGLRVKEDGGRRHLVPIAEEVSPAETTRRELRNNNPTEADDFSPESGPAGQSEAGREIGGEDFIPTDDDLRQKTMAEITARRGQIAFRHALIERYGGRCVISGCTVQPVLEAAHIAPYRGEKDNHPSNGLLLRCDLHTLFDLGLLGIDPSDCTVHIAPEAAHSGYEKYQRRGLLCPTTSMPSHEALKQRWRIFRALETNPSEA